MEIFKHLGIAQLYANISGFSVLVMKEKGIKETNSTVDMVENDDKYISFSLILYVICMHFMQKKLRNYREKSELAIFYYQLFCQKQFINCYSASVFNLLNLNLISFFINVDSHNYLIKRNNAIQLVLGGK